MATKPLRVLSLGAGVQSTTIALMAAVGEIEPPDLAIFADTQSEPAAVLGHLWWLAGQLPYPLYVVSHGSLDADSTRIRTSVKSGFKGVKSLIPAYVLSPDGKPGMMGRKCTLDYKINPIERMLRQLLGIKRVTSKVVLVEQWIGISIDEAQRMKPSRKPWIKISWPLIDARMSRADCLRWMKEHGYPEPPRSACYFCPFHSDAEWRRMQADEPEEFAKAVEYEKRLSEGYNKSENLRSEGAFLHSSRVPLDEVTFKNVPDRLQVSLFGNECEGLCGV